MKLTHNVVETSQNGYMTRKVFSISSCTKGRKDKKEVKLTTEQGKASLKRKARAVPACTAWVGAGGVQLKGGKAREWGESSDLEKTWFKDNLSLVDDVQRSENSDSLKHPTCLVHKRWWYIIGENGKEASSSCVPQRNPRGLHVNEGMSVTRRSCCFFLWHCVFEHDWV